MWVLENELIGTWDVSDTDSILMFEARNYGGLFSCHCTSGLGAGWYGARTPYSLDIPPEFLSSTSGCETSPFYVSTPPTRLDGCDFFNSVVARLHLAQFLMVLSDGCSTV